MWPSLTDLFGGQQPDMSGAIPGVSVGGALPPGMMAAPAPMAPALMPAAQATAGGVPGQPQTDWATLAKNFANALNPPGQPQQQPQTPQQPQQHQAAPNLAHPVDMGQLAALISSRGKLGL